MSGVAEESAEEVSHGFEPMVGRKVLLCVCSWWRLKKRRKEIKRELGPDQWAEVGWLGKQKRNKNGCGLAVAVKTVVENK